MQASLRARLEADLKEAMRAGDTVARDTIRFTLAAIKNAEIERGGALPAEEAEALLNREAKRRGDSIEQFRVGKREDLVAKEEAQLAVLRRYLPAQLTDEEVQALVERVIEESGAKGMADMAKVMPLVIERAGDRADGRRLSAAARSALSSASR